MIFAVVPIIVLGIIITVIVLIAMNSEKQEAAANPGAPRVERESPAHHFFTYLVSFLAMGFVATGVGAVLFQLINKFFPDVSSAQYQAQFDQGGAKFGIASILVAAPIYFLLTKMIVRSLREGRVMENSPVRRWLTYIVLFFAAGTIIGDLIALVFSVLEGEIAMRFMLKVLTILIIAGGIFGYYFWDMRRKEMAGKIYPENNLIGWVAVGFVSLVFVGAFFVVDSPKVAREKRIDLQTANNLSMTDNGIRNFASEKQKLPESLETIDPKYALNVERLKAESQIEYLKTGDASFQLCANFLRVTDVSETEPYQLEWKHSAGRVCFDRDMVRNEDGTLSAWGNSMIEKPIPAPFN